MVVGQARVLSEALAVIAQEDDDRVIPEAAVTQRLDQLTDLTVDETDDRAVAGLLVAQARRWRSRRSISSCSWMSK